MENKLQQKRDLTVPIRYVKGVGPKKTEILSKVNIETIQDIFYYLPYRYEDRSNFVSVSNLEVQSTATVKGEIKALDSFRTRKGVDVFQVKVDDGTGVIYAVWFNQSYISKFFMKNHNS